MNTTQKANKYCVELTMFGAHNTNGISLYTCWELYKSLSYKSFKERIEDLPSFDDLKTAKELERLVRIDYKNKYEEAPIIHVINCAAEKLPESRKEYASRIKESSVFSKKNDVLFYVLVKNKTHEFLGVNSDGSIFWTTDVQDAEAFEDVLDATDALDDHFEELNYVTIPKTIVDEIDLLDFKSMIKENYFRVAPVYAETFIVK